MKVKVETRKAGKVAYIEHVGAYDRIPFTEYIERLYGWAKANKVRPGFHPFGIYYDMPKETPSDKRRCEIGIPIFGDGPSTGGVKTKDLPEMKVASYSFKGPSSEYQPTYDALGAWIAENGYAWAGAPIEVYSKKPEQVGGQLIMYAKIQVPIRKK